MKVVYIAHPLGPEGPQREINRARAARWVAWAGRTVAPVATWITLSGEWPETEANRRLGLEIDCSLVGRCDEVWLVGGRISAGMRIEADAAREQGIPVVDLTHLGEEPPL